MKKRLMHLKNWLLLPVLTTFTLVGTPVSAQQAPAQSNRGVQDNDTTRWELANFDQFLDNHRELAEQLRRDPSLVNNEEFVKDHPALRTYLQDHPGVREEIRENPNRFMRQEARYDRREDNLGRDRDRDTTRRELANFDQFLDNHRDLAEQLRKDPSLVNNGEFVKNHPALQTYLQDHPGVREEIKENPNAFMRQEARYDRREDGRDRDLDRGMAHKQFASFGEFLGGHSKMAEQLSKDPYLVKNQEYMENHPELKEYLNAHPEVRQGLMENPQSFIKSSQEFSKTTRRTEKSPTADAKPKQ